MENETNQQNFQQAQPTNDQGLPARQQQQAQESIQSYQNRMMKGFSCGEDVRKYVSSYPPGAIKELFYMLAIDGMSLQNLEKIGNGLKRMDAITQYNALQHERVCYLKKVYTDNGEICKKVDEIHTATTNLISENKDLAMKSIESMRFALHTAVEEKNAIERNSSETIKNLQDQISEKEKEIRMLQSLRTQQNTSSSKNGSSDSNTSRKSKNQRGFFHFRGNEKKDEDDITKQFRQEFVNNGEYKAEQINFLLDCLEEGDTIEDICKWVSPKMDISIMRRLRSVYYKRKKVENELNE